MMGVGVVCCILVGCTVLGADLKLSLFSLFLNLPPGQPSSPSVTTPSTLPTHTRPHHTLPPPLPPPLSLSHTHTEAYPTSVDYALAEPSLFGDFELALERIQGDGATEDPR